MDHILRIATLNVQGIQPKLTKVFAMARAWNIDVLCVQEARVSQASYPSLKSHAAKQGYQHSAAAEFTWDELGRYQGGVITFARVPMVKLEGEAKGADRHVLTMVHMPRDEPIMLMNIHGTPGRPAETREVLHAALLRAVRLGRRPFFIGDLNLTPAEGAAAEAVGNGWLRIPETQKEQQAPTHDMGQHLDYGMCAPGLVVSARGQSKGVADHSLIYYDLACFPREEQYCYKSRAPITGMEDVAADAWDEAFLPHSDAFAAAEHDGDAETMWQLLSDSTEDFLCTEDARGLRRSLPPKVVRYTRPNGHKARADSNALAQLYKLQRLAQQWQSTPCPEVEASLHRRRAQLSSR